MKFMDRYIDRMSDKSRTVSMLVISVLGNIINWWMAFYEGRFYASLTLLGPVALLVFTAFLFRPSLAHQPRNKKDETIMWILALVGLALGVLNFVFITGQTPFAWAAHSLGI
jgi:membrane associated rhomboid family serine protease